MNQQVKTPEEFVENCIVKMSQRKEIPEEFLDRCLLSDGSVRDADEIVEVILEDTPDLGTRVNSVMNEVIKSLVQVCIIPEVEEYAKECLEESPRDEALREIRQETIERIRSEA